jgi:hypothetical protein
MVGPEHMVVEAFDFAALRFCRSGATVRARVIPSEPVNEFGAPERVLQTVSI